MFSVVNNDVISSSSPNEPPKREQRVEIISSNGVSFFLNHEDVTEDVLIYIEEHGCPPPRVSSYASERRIEGMEQDSAKRETENSSNGKQPDNDMDENSSKEDGLSTILKATDSIKAALDVIHETALEIDHEKTEGMVTDDSPKPALEKTEAKQEPPPMVSANVEDKCPLCEHSSAKGRSEHSVHDGESVDSSNAKEGGPSGAILFALLAFLQLVAGSKDDETNSDKAQKVASPVTGKTSTEDGEHAEAEYEALIEQEWKDTMAKAEKMLLRVCEVGCDDNREHGITKWTPFHLEGFNSAFSKEFIKGCSINSFPKLKVAIHLLQEYMHKFKNAVGSIQKHGLRYIGKSMKELHHERDTIRIGILVCTQQRQRVALDALVAAADGGFGGLMGYEVDAKHIEKRSDELIVQMTALSSYIAILNSGMSLTPIIASEGSEEVKEKPST